MRRRCLGILMAALILLGLLTGCGSSKKGPIETVADLAHGNYSGPNKIYLVENEEYVPYLVLTDDYNGNCLLLREFLLDEWLPYNDPLVEYPAYYENCTVDQYLNNDFYSRLSEYVSSQVVDSSIVITAKESLGYSGDETLTIPRKVFLLSLAELDFDMFIIFLREGEPLPYFRNTESRIAYMENGEPCGWWLRTPDTTSRYLISAISLGGVFGSCGVEDIGGLCLNGVRPAFCLPGDLEVTETNIEGETMFVLAKERTLE